MGDGNGPRTIPAYERVHDVDEWQPNQHVEHHDDRIHELGSDSVADEFKYR